MNRKLLTLISAILLCVLPIVAGAAVIFENPGDDILDLRSSDFDKPAFAADDFVLAPGLSTITDIHWTGGYLFDNVPPARDDFTIQFYADESGAPSAGPAFFELEIGDTGRTDTLVDYLDYDIYAYSVDIAPLSLTAGQRYWLSIANSTAGVRSDWFWSLSVGGDSDGYHRSSTTAPWRNLGASQVFQLTNDNLNSVASPGTVLLLPLALVALLRQTRRQSC